MPKRILPRITSEESWQKIIKNLRDRDRPFIVRRKRARHVLMINGKAAYEYHKSKIALSEEKSLKTKYYLMSIISRVKGEIGNYLGDLRGEHEIIVQRHGALYRNQDLWNSLIMGEKFWELDARHCFWRIAYLKGYISDKLYHEVLERGETVKHWRNMALACINAPVIQEYYHGYRDVIELVEDTMPFKEIYNNIRFTAYNLMGDIMMEIGEQNVIKYRTDGIFITEAGRKRGMEMLIEAGMMFRENVCRKVNYEEFRSWNVETPKDFKINKF